jgi:hypothetical protein
MLSCNFHDKNSTSVAVMCSELQIREGLMFSTYVVKAEVRSKNRNGIPQYPNFMYHVGFEVLTAASMKMAIHGASTQKTAIFFLYHNCDEVQRLSDCAMLP